VTRNGPSAMKRVVLLLVATMLTAACGHTSRSTQSITPATTATVTTAGGTTTVAPLPQQTTVRVYFLRDGKVAPVARSVALPAVATAALEQLVAGPTAQEAAAGYTSAARDTTTSVTITNGIATLDLPSLSHAGLAQVVYTLTQFPTVHGIRGKRSIGDSAPLTRADFEDVTPAILVESPLPGQTVTSPLRVVGTANTFEATFDLEILNSSGVRAAWRFVTASSGSGTRGTFDTTISFPRTGGLITLVAYEPSAENGKPLHVARIPLMER
jgi:immunoglobulin-like protein involved in spore germination/sporulation and spore germination protein